MKTVTKNGMKGWQGYHVCEFCNSNFTFDEEDIETYRNRTASVVAKLGKLRVFLVCPVCSTKKVFYYPEIRFPGWIMKNLEDRTPPVPDPKNAWNWFKRWFGLRWE